MTQCDIGAFKAFLELYLKTTIKWLKECSGLFTTGFAEKFDHVDNLQALLIIYRPSRYNPVDFDLSDG